MPAALIIPAPMACIKVVAVKARSWVSERSGWSAERRYWPAALPLGVPVCSLLQWAGSGTFAEEFGVFKAVIAWINCGIME